MRYRLSLLLLCCGMSHCLASAEADLRGFLEGVDAGAVPIIAGERLGRPRLLADLYRNREHQPLWTGPGPLASQAPELLTAIEESTRHGLNGADYHLDALRSLVGASDRHDDLALELLASDAFLQQVRHRSIGAVSPQKLDPEWHVIEPEIDALRTLEQAVAAGAHIHPLLDDLWPRSAEYRRLVEQRARLLELGEIDMVKVSPGPLLKPGQNGERVVALKERLLGPGDYDAAFDDRLRDAVVEFQRGAGLEPDGIVGDATLEVMNASRFSWIDRIDANLERWRWLPREVPDTYVRVNIASYGLRVVRGGEDALHMDVIVGRPYRRTPVFTANISYMVFNPYWNVPYKLAVEDKLPVLKNDPGALAAQGFEVRPEGRDDFVPVTAVDWSDVSRGSFHALLRQRPGPLNALGQVKLMLPNPYSVYLHDTPSRDLFSKQERSFSSGCVRLSRPLELASWVLENDGRADDARHVWEFAAAGQTKTVYLSKPLPVYLVYFTAFTDSSGNVVFRRDLYQRDAALVAALRGDPRT